MPLRQITRPDGSPWWIRAAYDPRDYTVPASELEAMRALARPGVGTVDVLDLPDGPFYAYGCVRRFERDGQTFVLLQHVREWAVEVELTRGRFGELRAVPPEEAWRLARASDTINPSRAFDFEGEPPP